MNGLRAPRTEFSTVMHSRGPCVSPLSVQPEMWCLPRINLLTLTGIRHSVLCPLRGNHFSQLVPTGRPAP